jgi:thioredoxin 1
MPNAGSKRNTTDLTARPRRNAVGLGAVHDTDHQQRINPMADGIATFSDATFSEEVGAADSPVLVDFWAEWCGPCKMIAPILEEIATENDGLKIGKLNVDDNPEVARQYQVMSIPTLIVFKDGQEAKRLIGAKGKGQLLEELGEFL